MTLERKFEEAQKRVKTLVQTPPATTLLDLYALYKQGTIGDVQGKRPGLLDVRGRAKFDAWAACKGLAREAAMEQYVALVEHLVAES